MHASRYARAAAIAILLLTWSAGSTPARAVPPEPPDGPLARVGPGGLPPSLVRGMPREALAEMRATAQARRMAAMDGGPSSAPPPLGQPGFSLRYASTFGETEVPFFDDTQHLNTPGGVWAGGNVVWVGEYFGLRALKYLSDGTFQMQIGSSGQPYALDDTEFYNINDVGVDVAGGIWVVDDACHVAHFDAGGTFLGELGEIWDCADENDHLAWPTSIAFDSDGNIYVSDTGNERVQVFESTGAHLATIGVTGQWGSDNAHFNWPRHIAIDSGDLLYVADTGNHRVQIFSVVDPSAITYVATLGVPGESGSDNAHLNWAEGVGVDATRIYVADSSNARVQIFDRTTRTYLTTLGTGWGTGSYEFNYPTDVAVDGGGRIYVADFYNHRVQQFSGALVYQRTFGTSGVPYLTDGEHFNNPSGVAVSNGGDIYVTEERGHRLLKLNAGGALQWAAGEPGVGGWDNTHLNWPGDVDVASSGQAYVADSGANRVQVFSSGGAYLATIGTGDWGTGNYEFKYPLGVAVDGSGNVYVADTYNHRVQVYNSSYTYVATLGVTGEDGTDNSHFSGPEDVDVDSSGYIYVADGDNSRVQVFNASRAYVRTLGETGVTGEDFGHLGYPLAVVVDGQGRTYVADDWPPRVQVHDALGQYLTTVAGNWGVRTGDLRSPRGVALDGAGNVYVADTLNQRIQKLARGVPDWLQSNINGFGSPTESVWALAPFDSTLYAGTWTSAGAGAQIWRRSGGTWSNVMSGGFGNPLNQAIDHLIEFDDALYAGTYNWDDDTETSEGGEIWRSTNGTSWTQVVDAGLGGPGNDNAEAFRFAIFDGDLYVGTCSGTGTAGGEVWRSASGDSGTWTQSVANGFSDVANSCVLALEPHAGCLYAGTLNNTSGGEVWRSPSGDPGTWSEVASASVGNTGITAFAEFNGDLYILTTHTSDAGSEIWRCHDCDSDFEQVVDNGLGNDCSRSMSALEVVGQRLYWVAGQSGACNAGLEVWWSATGDEGDWHQNGYAGFGDSNNRVPYWDNSVVAFNDMLTVGTHNAAHGGEIWVLLNDLFLPLVMRNYP